MTSLSVSAPVLGLGEVWVAVIIVVGVLGLIGLAVYSVWTLRKPENWEER
jgi:hypothetical protein